MRRVSGGVGEFELLLQFRCALYPFSFLFVRLILILLNLASLVLFSCFSSLMLLTTTFRSFLIHHLFFVSLTRLLFFFV
jgi:hypothetical protein